MRETQGTEGLDAGIETEARRLLTAAFEAAPLRPGLATDLAAAASGGGAASAASDVVGQVRRQAARQRRRRALVRAGAVGVAAAVAGGVTAGVVTGAGSASAPGSLKMLTDALVKTSVQSFTFNYTQQQTHSDTTGPSTTRASGAFDPATGTGHEDVTLAGNPVAVHVLFTGKDMYVSGPPMKFTDDKPWIETAEPVPPQPGSGSATPGSLFATKGFAGGEPLNPADLIPLLKSATTVSELGSASGPGWTGTSYRFTAPMTGAAESESHMSVHGTVAVDSSGRVRELTTVTQWQGESSVAGRPPITITNTNRLAFGGFGVPVTVTAPPASQADYKKKVIFPQLP